MVSTSSQIVLTSMPHKYLISAAKEYFAREVADAMHLKRNEWVYIPLHDEHRRIQALRGRESPPEFLIGEFSEEERAYLYNRRQGGHT